MPLTGGSVRRRGRLRTRYVDKGERKVKANPNKWQLRDYLILALLIALTTVVTRLFSFRPVMFGIEAQRVGFGRIPALLICMFYGPVGGIIAGAMGDIIGMIIAPMGAYNPIFTLLGALRGAVTGFVFLFFSHLNLLEGHSVFVRNLPAVLCGSLSKSLMSIFLTPWVLSMLYGVPMWALVWSRVLAECFHVPVHTLIICALVQQLSKVPVFRQNFTS